jgi:hypothetical protein
VTRPSDRRRAAASQAGIAVACLLALAVLAGNASPGFPPTVAAGTLGHALGRTLTKALHPTNPPAGEDQASGQAGTAGPARASRYALADIPPTYLALYQQAASTCPKLTWQVLAGIGKVETDHGRSHAPGVRSGLNRAGCCAGPMQFNLTNGPPSTWQAFGRGDVYDPRDAIPAAARKLCANGLAGPPPPADPCPQVLGPAALHAALLRYNHACWYAHEVVTLASRYATSSSPSPAGSGTGGGGLPASPDPFVVALAHNPRITTTSSHGCDPGPDLASGRLDLRVQSLLAVIAQRHTVRISCLRTGHSRLVKGTARTSNHWVWRAVDLDRVDGQPVSPTSKPARRLVAWLDGLQGPLRPAEVGSPWPLGHEPYFTDEAHQQHLHIGYSHQQTPG